MKTDLGEYLHLGCEHFGAGSYTPRHDGFGETAALDPLHDVVLLCATNLAQHDDHLHVLVVMVTLDVVHERCPWIPVQNTPDSRYTKLNERERERMCVCMYKKSELSRYDLPFCFP